MPAARRRSPASLACYNQQTEFVTALPPHEIGDACENFLRQFGVDTLHILRGGDRLGIYFLETGAAQRGQQGHLRPGGLSFATIKPGMIDWRHGVRWRRLVPLDRHHPGRIGGAAAASAWRPSRSRERWA